MSPCHHDISLPTTQPTLPKLPVNESAGSDSVRSLDSIYPPGREIPGCIYDTTCLKASSLSGDVYTLAQGLWAWVLAGSCCQGAHVQAGSQGL